MTILKNIWTGCLLIHISWVALDLIVIKDVHEVDFILCSEKLTFFYIVVIDITFFFIKVLV